MPLSSSFKCLSTLHTSTASQRAQSTFPFRAVSSIHLTVPAEVRAPRSAKRNSPPVMPFQCYRVNRPQLPSLPLEPTPRGSQLHRNSCSLGVPGFLHPVNLRLPNRLGICQLHGFISLHSVCEVNCLAVSHCPHCSLNPG